ncbi:MAG: hypothetical protein QF437_09295, partial [Planctomycetota bacterium]|nr:hypothetical protein [Planctomycetota bacterium]
KLPAKGWFFYFCSDFLGSLVLQNAHAEITVIGGLTREKVVAGGQTYEGIIQLRNSGDTPIEAKIYQTDYTFSADGKNLFGKPGELKRSNAKWIKLSHNFRVIPPKETVALNYTITVPGEGDNVGTFWSMVMVESAGKPPEVEKEKDKVAIGIKHVMRYGVQMVTHLGDQGKVKVKVLKKTVVDLEEGKKGLRVDISNTGERWVRPEVWVELYDTEGEEAGKFPGRQKRIFPGTSIRQIIDISALKPGKYQGIVVIDNKDDNVFGSRVKFEL